MDDFASLLNDQLKQLKKAVRKRGRINLLVAGKTGVGKSTLINAVFQGNFASTGQGRPATRNTRKTKKKGFRFIFLTREVSNSIAFWNRSKSSRITSAVLLNPKIRTNTFTARGSASRRMEEGSKTLR
jgi:septin family protein